MLGIDIPIPELWLTDPNYMYQLVTKVGQFEQYDSIQKKVTVICILMSENIFDSL